MAMDGDAMGVAVAAAIKTVRDAIDPSVPVTDSQIEDIYKAMCNEIVDHITGDGVTSTTVTGGSSAGTYPGSIA